MNARHALGPAALCATLLCAGTVGLSRVDPPAGAGPDLTAAIDSTHPNWPRRDIVITVTVNNVGDAPCPRSICRVLIRNAHPPRQTLRRINKDVRALDPGDRFLFSYSIKLGLGLFEIEAAADADGKIAEADETNNKARLTIAGQ
ncbi:MAG: hypothetical protein H6P95_868 [Candidatus Aminicenantes bacterium]|jgi:hypothetical protein|nr:hypothetical protein [Candidatus Aminicenantes bacterium]